MLLPVTLILELFYDVLVSQFRSQGQICPGVEKGSQDIEVIEAKGLVFYLVLQDGQVHDMSMHMYWMYKYVTYTRMHTHRHVYIYTYYTYTCVCANLSLYACVYNIYIYIYTHTCLNSQIYTTLAVSKAPVSQCSVTNIRIHMEMNVLVVKSLLLIGIIQSVVFKCLLLGR